MRVHILNTMMEEIIQKQPNYLYGFKQNNSIMICSIQQDTVYELVCDFKADIEDSISEFSNIVYTITQDGIKFYLNTKTGFLELDAEIINYTTDFSKRNQGIVDPGVYQDKTVALIGAGSGGSATATSLVRAGVTNLIVIDHDEVSVSNICRSEYDLSDIGRKKTNALYDKLLRINPYANIQLYSESALEMPFKQLLDILEASDLVIEATDNVKSKLVVNGIVRAKRPAIYPAVYDKGKGGYILITMPGLPCYEDVFHRILPEMRKKIRREWEYSTGQTKPMPSLISDIQIIVARSVKLALAILYADQDISLIEKITEPGCTLLLISNERGGVVEFEKPFQEEWIRTSIRPDCSCQTLC